MPTSSEQVGAGKVEGCKSVALAVRGCVKAECSLHCLTRCLLFGVLPGADYRCLVYKASWEACQISCFI